MLPSFFDDVDGAASQAGMGSGGATGQEPPTSTSPEPPTANAPPDAADDGSASGPVCSFSPDTPAATPSGEQSIGTLQAGDTVEAYNTTTSKAEPKTVQHVWVNHDTDLVDVHVLAGAATTTAVAASTATATVTQTYTGHGLLVGDDPSAAGHLVTSEQATASRSSTSAGETIHTTANHPGLVPALQILVRNIRPRVWVPLATRRGDDRCPPV